MFSAMSGINKASVPDAQEIHSLTPTYFASLDSNSPTSLPKIKSVLFNMSDISFFISFFIKSYCFFKSINLIIIS